MSKTSFFPSLLLFSLCLSACNNDNANISEETDSDTAVTETVLDNVDKIEGTISDAMINVEDLEENNEDTSEDEDTEEANDTSNNGEESKNKNDKESDDNSTQEKQSE